MKEYRTRVQSGILNCEEQRTDIIDELSGQIDTAIVLHIDRLANTGQK